MALCEVPAGNVLFFVGVGHFFLESGIRLGGNMVARHNRFSGILYKEGDSYHFHSLESSSSTALNPVLERIAGERVQLRIHAEPDGCKWYPGPCPAGHHRVPDMVLTFQEQGELTAADGEWLIGGKRVPLHIFEGHECEFEVYPSAEDIGARAKKLQEVLRKIRDL